MKVKLLKRIRKRFRYYFRKSDNAPVLVDHLKEKVIVFHEKYIVQTSNYKTMEELMDNIEVSFREYQWRIFKERIYVTFGYSMDRMWYKLGRKYANERSKSHL